MVIKKERSMIIMKKTKIICSIGPSSYDCDVMTNMAINGMDTARINFSHAKKEEILKVIESLKKVREKTNKNIALLYDTKGPEFRCGDFEDDGINLIPGKLISIVKEKVLGNNKRFSVNHPNCIDYINKGNIILLENGLMKLEVIEKNDDKLTCKIISGGFLGNKKSINVPGVKLNIPFINETDKEDILFAINHEADFLALSFVSDAEDVKKVRKLLKKHNSEPLIISKIENKTAINNLKEIIEVSDGVMVARGDLGVEVAMEELPFYQKEIITEARRQGKIAIVATEMLESMKNSIRPTRAEIIDVSNAVLNGADAVMLSGETTVGKYPSLTVKSMSNICQTAEKHLKYDVDFKHLKKDFKNAISSSVVETSNILNAKLIVAATMSGATAKAISNLRSEALVLATCTSFKTARRLALNFGVYPKVTKVYDTTDEIVDDAIKNAKVFMELKKDDYIIITGAFPKNSPTNFMKIEKI